MKKILFVYISSLFVMSCGGPYSFQLGVNNFVSLIEPLTFNGSTDTGGMPFDLSVPLSIDNILKIPQDQLNQISSITLNTIALRSLTDADFDQNHMRIKERLEDPKFLNQCVPGQSTFDFVESAAVFIQKNSDDSAENKPMQIAHISKSQLGNCSVMAELDIDPSTKKVVDLKSFFPNLAVFIKATGITPNVLVRIGGFISVNFIVPDLNVL